MAASSVTITGAEVRVSPERGERRDLHIADGLIAEAAAPDAEVIDGRGAVAVPLLVDSAVAVGAADRFDLRPGHPATFALVRGAVSPDRIRRMLVVDPGDLLAVFVDGAPEVRDGRAVRTPGTEFDDADVVARWIGAWRDDARDMTQHLRPDGRYSETRSGRVDAWTGRFWVGGDRITYLDDTGFWAFGQLEGGVLHHAGFVLTRLPAA